jgi:hypothetical protein
LRAAVQASKEATSVDSSSSSTFSSSSPGPPLVTDAEQKRAVEKRLLDAEVARLRKLRHEAERRRKQDQQDAIQREEAEKRRMKEEEELREMRREQHRIEEAKRRAQVGPRRTAPENSALILPR